jgi:hypothetical protein
MNHNKKTIKHQQQISLNHLKNSSSNFIEKHISEINIQESIDSTVPACRNRLYNPLKTISMFVSQAIKEDSSCQNIVNEVAVRSKRKRSISTSAYCKARSRLPEKVLSSLSKEVAIRNEEKVKKDWKFRNKNIYLVDGTTLIMPDTKANQKDYPQLNCQKEGLGFPICRIVAIISLHTGCVIDANIGAFSGKGAGEQGLLRPMLGNFKKGDIILADAFYSTYTLLSYAIEKGIDIVFVQNGARSRTTDFTKGEVLGENDHIITIKRPKETPDWMSEAEAEDRPKEIKIREIRIGGKVLITTMMCPKNNTAIMIQNLYKERWHIEVDFRNIKVTMGLDSFKCKTPEMVKKEMWVYFLAYNILRTLMLKSALYNKLKPRQISFKHCLQIYVKYLESCHLISYSKILKLIGEKVIGNRAGRIEPRAIKRRYNGFSLLMKPRNILRAEIKRNGHPKKRK